MNKEIIRLRNKINRIDKRMLRTLEKRMSHVLKIKKIKQKNNFKVEDKKREKEVIEERQKLTSLNKVFVKDICNLIFVESKRVQKQGIIQEKTKWHLNQN